MCLLVLEKNTKNAPKGFAPVGVRRSTPIGPSVSVQGLVKRLRSSQHGTRSPFAGCVPLPVDFVLSV